MQININPITGAPVIDGEGETPIELVLAFEDAGIESWETDAQGATYITGPSAWVAITTTGAYSPRYEVTAYSRNRQPVVAYAGSNPFAAALYAAQVFSGESECEGHPDGPVMGETFYCDGTCATPASAPFDPNRKTAKGR